MGDQRRRSGKHHFCLEIVPSVGARDRVSYLACLSGRVVCTGLGEPGGCCTRMEWGAQTHLRCKRRNIKHWPILKGVCDAHQDGNMRLLGRDEANDVEGFAGLLYLLY